MAALLKKIPATTLVETLVAMTIITLVTGFSMVIFLMVSAPDSSVGPLLQAQQTSSEMMDTLNPNHIRVKNTGSSIQVGNLWYAKKVSRRDRDLFQVEIEVMDNNEKSIYTRKRLIYASE